MDVEIDEGELKSTITTGPAVLRQPPEKQVCRAVAFC